MDYQGLYEDLLDIEYRAGQHGFNELAEQCFRFRVELLARYCSFVGYVRIA